MGFINPWALVIGGLALATPVLVHFLTRPRPQPMPLSTIHLVFASLQQKRSRHRLRDFLVLLMRMLVIAMVAAAIARPLWRTTVISTADTDASVARVVMIDVSASMGAGRGGSQPIGRSHAIADRYLNGPSDLSAAVVFVGARPESVFQNLSKNVNVLRQRARSAAATSQSADASAAILLAGELLQDTNPETQREVVIISDFQRSDWGSMRLSGLPPGTRVQLESVAADQTNNVAVVGVDTADRIVAGQPFSCLVSVRNDSGVDRTLDCRLTLGNVVETVRQTFPSGESSVAFSMQVDQAGPHAGMAELMEASASVLADDFPDDDLRAVSIDVSPPARIVLLSGQNPEQIPSSSYYLQRAGDELLGGLQTGDASGRTVRRMSPQRFDSALFAAADIVIVDHPGRLPTPLVKQLAGKMQRGAGVLYCVAELADAVNLAALEKQIGASMRLPVRYVPQRGGRLRRDLAIQDLQRREPPFAIFGDSINAALQSLRFGGGLATEATEEALADRVLATLEDQTALLAVADGGAGRIAILNADLQQSNLPVQPAFVPLLGEIIAGLMPTRSAESSVDCGRPMVRLLPSEVGPDDEVKFQPVGDWVGNEAGHGSMEVSSTGMTWTWKQPLTRGVFAAFRSGKPVSQVAINIPASESELTMLRPDNIDALAMTDPDATMDAGQVGFRDATADQDDKDRWWNVLMSVCVLGLAGEMVMLRIFRN